MKRSAMSGSRSLSIAFTLNGGQQKVELAIGAKWIVASIFFHDADDQLGSGILLVFRCKAG
jgi:hypothetical protein